MTTMKSQIDAAGFLFPLRKDQQILFRLGGKRMLARELRGGVGALRSYADRDTATSPVRLDQERTQSYAFGCREPQQLRGEGENDAVRASGVEPVDQRAKRHIVDLVVVVVWHLHDGQHAL